MSMVSWRVSGWRVRIAGAAVVALVVGLAPGVGSPVYAAEGGRESAAAGLSLTASGGGDGWAVLTAASGSVEPVVIVSDGGAVVASCANGSACSARVRAVASAYQARQGDARAVAVVDGPLAGQDTAVKVGAARGAAPLSVPGVDPVFPGETGELFTHSANGWTVSISREASADYDPSDGWANSAWYQFVASATPPAGIDPADGYTLWVYDITGDYVACSGSASESVSCPFYGSWDGFAQHEVVARVTSGEDVTAGVVAEVGYEAWYDRSMWVSYMSDRYNFAAGEELTFTIWSGGVASSGGRYAVWVQDQTTGQILARCQTSPCEPHPDGTYYSGEHAFRVWIADADDPLLHVAAMTTPKVVPRLPWLTYLFDTGPVVGGKVPVVGANMQDVGATHGAYVDYFYDATAGRVVDTCTAGDPYGYYEGLTYCYSELDVTRGHVFVNIVAAPTGPFDDVQAISRPLYMSAEGPVLVDGPRRETSGGYNPSEAFCQDCAGDPVNTVTGEFYETVTDLSAGGDLVFARSYASGLADQDAGLGWGWSLPYGMRLQIGADASGANLADATQLVVVQENGSFVPFARIEGELLTLPRVHASLAEQPDGTFVFKRANQVEYTFDATGALTAVNDRNGNTTTLTYDATGQLATVSDDRGRSLSLTWTDGHLATVADQSGRTIGYGYTPDGELASVTGPDEAISSYEYDQAHRIVAIIDPRGARVEDAYDSAGRVTAQTDALGGVTSFDYELDNPTDGQTVTTGPDGSVTRVRFESLALVERTVGVGTDLEATTGYQYAGGQVILETNPLGDATAFTYDEAGNRTSSTDPLGRVSTATYNALNEPLTVTNPAGEATAYGYDEAGNLLSATDPTGATTTYTVNPDGTLATASDPTGAITSYTYDVYGQPATVTDPAGGVSTTSYNSLGWLLTSTDPRGATPGADAGDYTNTFSHDPAGRITGTLDPLGGTTTTAYDLAGNPTSWTDPLGAVTTATYDLAGHLLTRTEPGGASTAWTYDGAGRVSTLTDADGATTTFGYDVLGRRSTVTDPLGRTTTTGYDAADRVTSVTTPSGAVTSYGYDDAGQLLAVTDPLGHTTATSYDQTGRPATVTDPLGRAVTTSYDLAGRVTSVQRADGSSKTWAYDQGGRTTGYTDPAGATTTYGYDAAGRHVSTTDTAARTTTLGYDPAGNQTSTTYPDGGTVTRSYDALNRLVGVDYSDTTPDETRSYDAASRLTTATAGTSTTSYTYDTAGKVAQVSTDGAAVGYTWTPAGTLAQLTYPGGQTVTYTHDQAGQLTSLTDWADRDYTYTWTDDAQVESLTYPNGTLTSYDHDDAGQVLAITTTNDAGTQLLALAYGYDEAGQLTTQTTDRSTGPRAPPAIPVSTSDYTFDLLGRIDQTTGTGAGNYDFTPADQITTLADGRTLTYDTAGQATTLTTPATGGQPAQITSYTYDARGNRTTATTDALTTSYGHDQANRLSSVTDGTGTADYTYEASGLRATSTTTAGTQHYTWDTLAAVPTLLTDTTHLYLYGVGPTPLAQQDTDTSQVSYLHTDLIGTVRTVTDASTTITGDADYTPYGTPIAVNSEPAADITPFGYAGQYTDPTGLLYLRARYYDPTTAQFTTRDPLEGLTTNPYGYTGGNPLQHTDPLGLIDWGQVLAVGLVTAAVVGVVACAVSVVCGAAVGAGGLALASGGAAVGAGSLSVSGVVATATLAGVSASSMNVMLQGAADGTPPLWENDSGDGRCDSRNLSEQPAKIAEETGYTRSEINDAIHAVKQDSMPRSGAFRNPDVFVDTNTGEVYVKMPNGSASSDSIGNIFDFLG